MSFVNRLSYWIATWFKVGLWPRMPGTWGSLMAIPPAALIYLGFGSKGLIIATIIVFLLGLIATYFVLYSTLDTDPSFVVIDEVVGQWLVLWAVGSDIRFWFLGFIFFRVFDILKPYPIRDIENYYADGAQFSKSMGIMMDDIAAGGYSIVCLCVLKIMFA